MMSEATLLESRVDKLEQDNRRLKLTLGALLLALAAVPLIGAVTPEQIQAVIQARKFEVIGENGTRRAGLNATGIGFTDESNNIRAGMNADGIAYFDESGDVVWCAPGC
jgi:hypothetical protein